MKRIAWLGCILSFAGGLLLVPGGQTHAQTASTTACNTYKSGVSIQPGYGAAWDFFSSGSPLLVKTDCPTTGNVTITVGGGKSTQYVYEKIYVLENEAWKPYSLQGATRKQTSWFQGSATISIPKPASGPLQFIAHVCSWQNNSWKCGCKDQACSESFWQLQAYEDGTTTGGNSGGGGTAGGQSLGSVRLAQTLGVRMSASNPFTAFRDLTGIEPMLYETFVERASGWGPINGSNARELNAVKAMLQNNPGKGVVFSYAPIPTSEGFGTGPLTKCSNGDYNSHYRAFADKVESMGLKHMVIRVGWEWQGDYYPWGVDNDVNKARLFAGCYRQVVTSFDQAYPTNGFVYDWNPTFGVKADVLPAAWPGDQYVDIVGIDVYDLHYGNCGTTEPCRWNVMMQNINRIKSFAQSKGKPISIPEWGVWEGTNGAGDNAYFVQKMCEFVKNPANNVAYHIYFERDADSDHRLSTHPKSLQAYKTYCKY